MKEFTKKQFLQIIQEENELDEMGKHVNFPAKGRYIFDPEKEKTFTKGKGPQQNKEKQSALIGYDLKDNPDLEVGDIDEPEDESKSRIIRIISSGEIDLEEFKRDNEDLLKKLQEEFQDPATHSGSTKGGFYLTTDVLPFNWPYQKKDRIIVPIINNVIRHDLATTQYRKPYEHSGDNYSITEKIRREFNPIVRKYFNFDGELKGVFNKFLLPKLHLDDELYTNRYLSDNVNNDVINLESHSLSSFPTSDAFKKLITHKMTFKPLSDIPYRDSYYMPRLYNPKYTHYDPTKKNKMEYKGLTPIYKLEKYRLAEENLDVTIMSNLAVHGTKTDANEYVWIVKFSILFARKRPDQETVEGNMQLLKDFINTKVVNFNLPSHINGFDSKYCVMDNHEIRMGLEEALSDVGTQIKSMPPNELLKIGNYGISDIQKQPMISENKVEIAIQNVIKEVMTKQ